MDEGVWLYAVTRDVAQGDLRGVVGVAGEPVRLIEVNGLAAVGGTVDLGSFGETALKRDLEDLDWLAGTARAHDGVVRAVAAAGVTLPLRLATVYLGDDRVRAWLAQRAHDFAAALDQLAGRSEWAVKVYLVRPKEDDAKPAASGTAYLKQRRTALSERRTASRRAARDATEIHSALASAAVAARLHPLRDGRLTGVTAAMVLNGAYLVDQDHANEFAVLAAALEQERPGIELAVTGPWPPYSFSRVEEG